MHIWQTNDVKFTTHHSSVLSWIMNQWTWRTHRRAMAFDHGSMPNDYGSSRLDHPSMIMGRQWWASINTQWSWNHNHHRTMIMNRESLISDRKIGDHGPLINGHLSMINDEIATINPQPSMPPTVNHTASNVNYEQPISQSQTDHEWTINHGSFILNSQPSIHQSSIITLIHQSLTQRIEFINEWIKSLNHALTRSLTRTGTKSTRSRALHGSINQWWWF